jgi:hypothetical protein
MMNSESDAIADRPPQYSLRQLAFFISVCGLLFAIPLVGALLMWLMLQVGLVAAILAGLILVQAPCFLLFESLRSSGEPADRQVPAGKNSRIAPFEQNE